MNSEHSSKGRLERSFGRLKESVMKDRGILGLYLFGSAAREELNKLSDIDVCLILYPEKYSSLFLSEKKLEFLKEFPELDVQIFQQLPLYIRIRVLREGKRIACKDEDQMYRLAFKTITEYSDYEHILNYYLKETERGG